MKYFPGQDEPFRDVLPAKPVRELVFITEVLELGVTLAGKKGVCGLSKLGIKWHISCQPLYLSALM